MTSEHVAFIGLDTSKLKISVAVADGERNGEVRFLGDISSEPASVAGMVSYRPANAFSRARLAESMGRASPHRP